jgi:hypothetical protein
VKTSCRDCRKCEARRRYIAYWATLLGRKRSEIYVPTQLRH